MIESIFQDKGCGRGHGMKVGKEFVLCEMGDDYILMPTEKTALDFNSMIVMNEVGASIWKMLQNEVTVEELVKGILDEYDVEEEIAREDIQEFLDNLVNNKILTKGEIDAV